MPGSSRDLSKSLDQIFSEWSDDNSSPEQPAYTELFSVISQYLDKHNTLASLRQQSVNDELFRVYDKYIMPLQSLPRECMFLDVLTALSPVLSSKEISLWVKSYLKPAVDSAGYDSMFVEKARQFIKKVCHGEETDDSDLESVRDDIGKVVIDQILSINLSDDILEEALELKVSDADKDSQSYQERLRFIKSNCNHILQNYGVSKTKRYCELLNDHITIPSQRLETLLLLSSLVNSKTLAVPDIINMPVFPNVLKCAMFDFSETVIHTALTILTMLIPQVSTSMSYYLPDLFMIYIRITTWEEFNSIPNRFQLLSEYLNELKIDWDILVDNEETSLTFNYPHFYVLLYGLFPFNFCKLSQAPYTYLKLNKPSILTLKYLNKLEDIIELPTSLDLHIRKMTKSILQTFLMHPKFLNFDTSTLEQELEHPTSWIEGEITHEEIALACFSLNPDVMINLDSSSIYGRMLQRSLTSSQILCDLDSRISRGSSIDGLKESKYLQMKAFHNLNRKMSIIPTNLVINNKQPTHDVEKEDGVQFKEVKYETENTEDSIDSLDGSSRSPGDPLQELFHTHEKLYAPINKNHNLENDGLRRKSSSLINVRHELRLSRPTSSPTTTLETSSVFKESASTNGSNNDTLTSLPHTKSDGNMIDFYQRELLLFKNELEFSSYMKHLNKYNYMKLKLNKSGDSKTIEMENNEKKIDDLKESFEELNGILTSTKQSLSQAITEHEKERDQLITRLNEVQTDKEELVRKYETTMREHKLESQTLKELVDDIIPQKDFEIVSLQMKIKNLEQMSRELEDKLGRVGTNNNLQELEKKIGNQNEIINKLKSEMSLVTEKHNQVVNELSRSSEAYDSIIRKYEHKLASSKLNLNENLNSFTSQYERKIQELTTTILKYEHLLEEKNGKILQLSSSKPISIPSYGRKSSYNDFEQHTDRSHSSSESSSPPHTSAPIAIHHPHPPAPIHYQTQPQAIRNNSTISNASSSSQQVPIMRGRGGYQKRSKKLM
ncbi:uncharacterized protein SPAPADRAFT_150671 [Spathaspora passalidarum NRRL Y-27907]|uniref:Uncharacterized protein n=1 Tax=Spathaspora passalidarum (strain NRRL Y-27907 / 11-Y1) TaxID=619300 RepID=G3AL25_SPAPN|nr:uncharacterized protein SPAPADRAFT_150671 [Spathaspora passalidarum NRRL Y-27907]EGW33068.1 hypothetical protein SPAPADRAFT_150671 [Spathaspora passalidarum NRRL Y-27907]